MSSEGVEPTVDGIRGHKRLTSKEAEQLRVLAEQTLLPDREIVEGYLALPDVR